MRSKVFVLGLTLALAPALPAAAQSTPPGYTAQDQAQQAKLEAGVGTWNCVDTPASKSPDVVTIKHVGNWYVGQETGDDPGTWYMRWSHTYQNYFANEIDDSGSAELTITTSPDPYNATWTFVFPVTSAASKQNFPLQPYTMKLVGNTMTTTGQFYDPAGKLENFSQVCTKT